MEFDLAGEPGPQQADELLVGFLDLLQGLKDLLVLLCETCEPALDLSCQRTHLHVETADLAGDSVHSSFDSGEFCCDASQFGPEDVAQ